MTFVRTRLQEHLKALSSAPNRIRLRSALQIALAEALPEALAWTLVPDVVTTRQRLRLVAPNRPQTRLSEAGVPSTAATALSLVPVDRPTSRLVVSVTGRDGGRVSLVAVLPPDEVVPDDMLADLTEIVAAVEARALLLRLNEDAKAHDVEARLTPSERAVLEWIQDGKSTWETATILYCSVRTVRWHLANAAKKLGTVNRAQTVARALARGFIRARTGLSHHGKMIG